MLTLPIKKKWFDLILVGEKKEEYREITEYYQKRFKNLFIDEKEKEIAFRNGYSKNSPMFIAKCSLSINTGNPNWGAKTGKKYFVLKINKIVKARC